jgi:hypothetical protein
MIRALKGLRSIINLGDHTPSTWKIIVGVSVEQALKKKS